MTLQRLDYMSCTTCVFFNPINKEAGNCFRYPPTLIVTPDGVGTAFPMLHPDAMCGEWKADQETAKRVFTRAALSGADIGGMGHG